MTLSEHTSNKRKQHWHWAALIACIFVLGAGTVDAQVNKGSLFGAVRDDSGTPIPGAAVALTSDALRNEPRVTQADAAGRFRLLDLPRGTYVLEVSVPARGSYREEDLELTPGARLNRIVILPPRESDGLVVSSPDAMELDERRSSYTTSFDPSYLDDRPRLRFSHHDATKIAPGVTPESPSSLDVDLVATMGSSVDENVYLLDGIDITTPFAGRSGASPATDVIEAIEVLAAGATSDYGAAPGGVFNVVTRSGGPIYAFDFNLFSQPRDLAGDSVVLDCDCRASRTGYVRDRFRDASFHLGGPLRGEDAWFFAGYQHFRDFASQPGADPEFPNQRKADRLSFKVDWNYSPRVRLTHSFHADIWRRPETPSRERPFGSQVTAGGSNFATAFTDVFYERSENTAGHLRFSGFFAPGDFVEPNNGDRTKPFRFDAIQGRASGGARGFGNFSQKRVELKATVSHYARNFLARSHDFKFGIQLAGRSHEGSYGYPGGARYYDYPGYGAAVNNAVFREPFSYGGASRHFGMFVDDVVPLGERFTLSLGLRFDHENAKSQDVSRRDSMGNETGATIAGSGSLFSWNRLSPRIGLVYRLTEKTLVRFSYARLHRGVLTSELDAFHPGNTSVTGAAIDPTTGAYSNVLSFIDPTANLAVDPDIRSPRTDEIALTLDRQLFRGLSVGMTLVTKRLHDPVGWVDTGGVYSVEGLIFPTGETLPIQPRLNGAANQRFMLTNPPEWGADYKGLVIRAAKDWNRRWRASFSYTFSESEGLISSNQPLVETADGLSFAGVPQRSDGALFFGRDPNDLTNARGKLRSDRTNVFRLETSLLVPWADVFMKVNYHYLTGKPWAAIAFVPLPQGIRPIYLEPPGVRRLPSQNLVDVRFSRVFRPDEVVVFDWMGRVPGLRWLGRTPPMRTLGAARMELIADVFNVANDRAFEEVATSNFVSPNFGEGVRFIAPRRLMIGLKVAF